jgi:transposase InsO family protein
MEEGSTSAAQPDVGEAEPVVSIRDVGMERLVALMGKLTTEQFEAFASSFKEGKLALTEVEGELKPVVPQTSGEQSSQPPSRYDNFVMPTLGTRDPNDPTSVNSGKVEIASMLEEDGTNIDLWDRDVIAAVNAKGKWCGIVLLNHMPGTEADGEVQRMLRKSISQWMAESTAGLESAHQIYTHIKSQYTGGSNWEINETWVQELDHKKMLPTQKYRHFVFRKALLIKCLMRNGYSVLANRLARAVFGNLPVQFASQVDSMANGNALATPEHMIMVIKAAADRIGYVEGEANQPSAPRAGAVQAGQEAATRIPRCWRCGQLGHIRAECPQRRNQGGAAAPARQAQAGMAAPLEAAGAPPHPQGTATTSRIASATAQSCDASGAAILRESWAVDGGATIMLTHNLEALHEPTLYPDPLPILLATSAVGGTVAKGSICLARGDRRLWLSDVHCDPSATQNLLSVSSAVDHGMRFSTNSVGEPIGLWGPEGYFCDVVRQGGLYVLAGVTLIYPSSEAPVASSVAVVSSPEQQWKESAENLYGAPAPIPIAVSAAVQLPNVSIDPQELLPVDQLRMLYHRRLAHLSPQALDRMIRDGMVEGLPAQLQPTGAFPEVCEECIAGKGVKSPFRASRRPPTKPLEVVHLDTAGKLARPGVHGEHYFVTIYDGFTGWRQVILVRTKDEIPGKLRAALMQLMNLTGRRILKLQTDRGTEFLNATMKEWADSLGIKMRSSCPGTPQQNGAAERCVRTIKDRARSMLMGKRGPHSLWTEAVAYAAWVSNYLPVAGKSLTPYEALWGIKPDISDLRIWGCLAYVLVPRKDRDTLEPIFVPGMFVGMDPDVKGWRVRVGNKTVRSRDVRFLEHKPGVTTTPTLITQVELDQIFAEDFPVLADESTSAVAPVPPSSPIVQLPQATSEEADDDEEVLGSPSAPLRKPIRVAVTPCKGKGSDYRPVSPAPTPVVEGDIHPAQGSLEQNQATPSSAVDGHTAPTEPTPPLAGLPQEEEEHSGVADFERLDTIFVNEPEPPEEVDGHPLSDRDKRAWRRQYRKDRQQAWDQRLQRDQRLHEEAVQQFQASGQDQSGHTERSVEGIPVHENVFDLLPAQLEEVVEETEEVDVTGYTGRTQEREERGEPDSTSTDWDSEEEETTESPPQVAHVQKGWIRGVPWGTRSGLKPPPREGVLKVSFSETPVTHWYVPEPESSRSWERPVSAFRPEVMRHKVKQRLRAGRKGVPSGSGPSSRVVDDPYFVLEEVGSGSTVPLVSLVSGEASEPGLHPRFVASAREEAFLHSLFERESTPFVFAVVDSEGLKHQIPKTLREARLSPQWPMWRQACIDELDSIDKHGTHKMVPRPPDKRVLPTHWVLAPKIDGEGVIYRHKARLVVNGDRQRDGIDVKETFAPTATAAARRALLSMAATLNMEVHQADIKTAFLHGELEEEVYVEQPPGFGNGDPNQVWLLQRSLYGLKQAPRCWWQKLTKELKTLGFVPCLSDPGIYVNLADPTHPIYLGVFVDDMAIVGHTVGDVDRFKEQLKQLFEIHDLGEIKDFLGASIIRDRDNRVLYMRNTAKIDEYVEDFGLGGETRPVKSPMTPGFVITQEPLTVIPATQLKSELKYGSGVPLEAGNRYGELVGCLLYIANHTRPDISTATGILSQYRACPTTAHMQEGLRILRYLKDTRLHALRLGGGGPVMEAYTDADYAGCLDTRHSRSGFLVKVMGGVVSWASKKQKTVSTSTVEAEFQAACLAIKEVVWLKGFLKELGVTVGEVRLKCDNQGCLSHLKHPVISGYTKHAAVRFCYAREAVELGLVVPEFVSTDANVADIFTKPLPPTSFLRHRDALGVVALPPHLVKGKC